MQLLKRCFYFTSLFLSGASLVTMTLLILAQIVARSMEYVIPSSEDFAGWLLSATVFFGLAFTFNNGGHIRVSILLIRLSASTRRILEIFNLFIGLLISGFLMVYTIYTVYESYIYEEVSDTYLAVDLWLVQLPMAVGSLFLFIAILDNTLVMLKGKTPEYLSNEESLESME
ncbi:TRAP transporter small permease [Leucothrix arctica]|uniref:TRAP transporter small permease protein n=1 Tax=Leucothrix arctica TaxID=1481894 RepID=A0A317CFS5_9GAMM|nr:TRAP transporter small permease subunit [Leucothrix arctica]PWQ96253.1 TRAP transporter small permease [Leucothrix arctica]